MRRTICGPNIIESTTKEDISFVGEMVFQCKLNSFKMTHANLTSRQLQIIEYIIDGLCSKEIAKKLSISIRTVHRHRENIHAIIGTKSSGQLIKWYISSSYTRNP